MHWIRWISLSIALGGALAAAPTMAAGVASGESLYAANLMEQLGRALRPPADSVTALTGTAFFVSQSGDLLTVAHVVQGCERIDLMSEAMPPVSANVVASEAKPDLAVLHVTGVTPPAVLNFARAQPADGQALAVLGYPSGSDLRRATASRVNAADGSNAKLKSSRYVLVMSGMTGHGDSGGPVLDAQGHVVGLLKGGYDSPEMAQKAFGVATPDVSVGQARDLVAVFYQHAGLGNLPIAGSLTPIAATSNDPIVSARRAVVRVVCWQAHPAS